MLGEMEKSFVFLCVIRGGKRGRGQLESKVERLEFILAYKVQLVLLFSAHYSEPLIQIRAHFTGYPGDPAVNVGQVFFPRHISTEEATNWPTNDDNSCGASFRPFAMKTLFFFFAFYCSYPFFFCGDRERQTNGTDFHQSPVQPILIFNQFLHVLIKNIKTKRIFTLFSKIFASHVIRFFFRFITQSFCKSFYIIHSRN